MSEQAAAADSGKWRPPSNLREGIATLVALVVTLVVVQVLAPLAKQATFLTEEIRNYVAGLGFAVFPSAYQVLNQGLQSLGGRAGLVRPDLPPWFVTGLTAAALLFAWNTFVGFFTGLGLGVALGQLTHGASVDKSTITSALMSGGLFTSLPLTAFAAIFAGMLLNRWTRSGVLAALLLASLAYLALNVFLTNVVQPETIRTLLSSVNDPVQMAAVGVGVSLVAIITFLFGGIGVILSRVRHERSLGKLVNAARKLSPSDRDAVTQFVLDRIEKKV